MALRYVEVYNLVHTCGGWAKLGANGLKMGSIVPFGHPKWPNIIYGKTHF